MKIHWPYKLLNAGSVLTLVFGLFALVDGLLRGSDSGPIDTLRVGAVCVSAGVLWLVLSDLGMRLYRIEQKLGTLPPDPLEESAQPPPARRHHQ